MQEKLNSTNNESKIKIKEITIISNPKKEINKILLLNYTNNLICSYEETIEIFQLNYNKGNNNETIEELDYKKLNSIQKIIDPNFNCIEFLYETKQNLNNKNYLLICSDMIHVYYLYDKDKKSILLQSINQFGYQYINQVIEKIDGKIISLSNEYKISVFNNNLIKNDEIIDYNFLFNKGDIYIEKFREEIYELNMDKLNKDNEKIYSIIELFPDKLAYIFRIENDDEIIEINNINNNDNININDIDDEFIYVKFLDKDYNYIKELKICENDGNIYDIFQINERIMIVINDSYINLIDLKYYEIISKILTDKINNVYSFQKNSDFLHNNFINYLFLGKEIFSYESYCSDSEESDDIKNNYELNLNIYDLINIISIGFPKKLKCEYKGKEIDLNNLFNISKILEMSIIPDKEKNNLYHCVINNISDGKIKNEGLYITFFNFEIQE